MHAMNIMLCAKQSHVLPPNLLAAAAAVAMWPAAATIRDRRPSLPPSMVSPSVVASGSVGQSHLASVFNTWVDGEVAR